MNGGPGGEAASWVDVTVPITARLPEFHKAGGLGPGHRELSLGSIAKVRDSVSSSVGPPGLTRRPLRRSTPRATGGLGERLIPKNVGAYRHAY